MHRSGSRESDKNGADRRALDAAQSTDHHDGETQDDDIRTEPGLHRYLGCRQRARQRCEQHAEGKGARIDAVHPDAHADAHLLVVNHGQHDLAHDGAIEAKPDRKANGGGGRNQQQIVADVIETGEFNIAEQLVGLGCVDRVHAPDQLRGVLQDQKHRIGHQQEHHFVAAVEQLQEAALEQQADDRCDQGDRNEHRDKAQGRRKAVGGRDGDGGRRDIGAERIEAAVSDVENLEHAEYQRQSQGNDEQPGSLDQPVENNRQKQIHGAVMPIIVSEGR